MRIKNKKRFIFSMLIFILLLCGLTWGIVAGVKSVVANYKLSQLPMSENPNIKRVKDVVSPEILALINDNDWGVTAEMVQEHPLPETDTFEKNIPDKYLLKDGVFEKQDENECSGFAVAYVLRFCGREANGKATYFSMPNTALPNGYRLPVDIADKLRSEQINSSFYTGTLKTLKGRLVDSGKPVIVLVGKGLEWQHYITLVGYDDSLSEMYFYDSNMEKDENAEKAGNRTVASKEFEVLWNNGLPILENLYIAVK